MAKCKVKTKTKREYVLKLNQEEAHVLRAVVGSIIGTGEDNLRHVTNDLFLTLNDSLDEEPPTHRYLTGWNTLKFEKYSRCELQKTLTEYNNN